MFDRVKALMQQVSLVLQEESLSRFSLSELSQYYSRRYDPERTLDKRQLSIRIRYVLNVMTQRGLLEKQVQGEPRAVWYCVLPAFLAEAGISESSSQELTHDEPFLLNSGVPAASDLQRLKREAKAYRVDLMANIGESEEYQRLFIEYPSMKASLHEEYVLARDNSSKLLGRLKAVEAAIRQYANEVSLCN